MNKTIFVLSGNFGGNGMNVTSRPLDTSFDKGEIEKKLQERLAEAKKYREQGGLVAMAAASKFDIAEVPHLAMPAKCKKCGADDARWFRCSSDGDSLYCAMCAYDTNAEMGPPPLAREMGPCPEDPKPPIAIIPGDAWRRRVVEDRISTLIDAIFRFRDKHMQFPLHYIMELSELWKELCGMGPSHGESDKG